MNILLPVVIFLAWIAFTIAPSGKIAIEDTQNQVPADKRRGTSILPVFPVFPAMIWGLTLLLGRFISPIILWIVLGLHALMFVASCFVIIRDILTLKRIKI